MQRDAEDAVRAYVATGLLREGSVGFHPQLPPCPCQSQIQSRGGEHSKASRVWGQLSQVLDPAGAHDQGGQLYTLSPGFL